MRPAASVSVRDLSVAYGSTEVLRSVSLDVAPGAVVALLGPSGCGKTTLLRAVAGLERPTGGQVLVDDQVLSGPDAFMAPERRRIGMVFQDWALFPHMTVGANVGYGLGRRADRGAVAAALALVGLPDVADRQPATLSGGQQQRVALARALAPRPSVLLLDEPFSNLDTSLRVQVRSEVAALLHEVGTTALFVTHDQAEAFVLGDEVAVMRDGRIVQQASPADLYARPHDAEVAAFVGEANLLPGRRDGGSATTICGPVPLVDVDDHREGRGPDGDAGREVDAVEDGPGTAGDAVTVLARPEELVLAAPGADGISPGAVGRVEVVEFYGHDTVYVVQVEDPSEGGPTPPLRVRDSSAPRWRRGDAVVVRHSAAPTTAWPA